MRPDLVRAGPWTHGRAALLHEQLDELSKLSSLRASYPLLLDQTPCGWVLSIDTDAIASVQTSNNPVTATNPINPVVNNTINNFTTQGGTVINLTDATNTTTITGVNPGTPGQTVIFQNNTNYAIYFTHLDSGSDTTSQITTPTKTTLIIPPCHTAALTYGKGTDPDVPTWGVTVPVPPIYEAITAPELTTSVNNYNPTGGDTATAIRLTSDAERTITGLAGGWPDRQIILRNVGTNNIILTDEDTGSTATNRFKLPSDQPITLRPDDSVTMIYDDTSGRWRVDAETTHAGFKTATWLKYSPDYTDYNDTAGPSKSVTFYTLPTRGVLHKVVIKTSTAWAGTGITSVAGDVTVDGNNAVSAYDLDAAVADNNFASLEDSGGGATPYTGLDFLNFGGTRAVALALTSGGANLDQLTAGVVDIWLLVSVLP